MVRTSIESRGVRSQTVLTTRTKSKKPSLAGQRREIGLGGIISESMCLAFKWLINAYTNTPDAHTIKPPLGRTGSNLRLRSFVWHVHRAWKCLGCSGCVSAPKLYPTLSGIPNDYKWLVISLSHPFFPLSLPPKVLEDVAPEWPPKAHLSHYLYAHLPGKVRRQDDWRNSKTHGLTAAGPVTGSDPFT